MITLANILPQPRWNLQVVCWIKVGYGLLNRPGSYRKIEHFQIRSAFSDKAGKEIRDSSRLEFLEKFSTNKFTLLYAEDNTWGPLNRGGIADSPLFNLVSTIFLYFTKKKNHVKNYEKSFLFHLKSSFHSQDIWRYTNADMKIYQYLCLHIKIIYQRFHITTLLTFSDIHTKIYKMSVYKHTETIVYDKKQPTF